MRQFFDSSSSEAWLNFVHCQAARFHRAISQLEGTDVSLIRTAEVLSEFTESLSGRLEEGFLPLSVKAQLKKLSEKEADSFVTSTKAFLSHCIAYLEKWCGHFEGLTTHKWALLRQIPSWSLVENSVACLKRVVGFDDDAVFDEFRRVCLYITPEKLRDWNAACAAPATRWSEIFKHFDRESIPMQNIGLIVEYLFCLPGTNAEVESFSSITRLWTSDKTQLSISTLKALLIVKTNYDALDCSDFSEKIQHNLRLIQAINSSNKYQ